MYQYYLSLYFHHTNLFLSLLNYAILDLIYLSQSHGYRGGCLLKIFVISDVHGYFLQMITALNEAGFNPNNEDHWLFVLGDIIDRGREPQQIIDYLISLPRKVLIRGNHYMARANLTHVQCYTVAGIDKKLFSKIKSNPTYLPSKPTILKFVFALRLSIKDAQQLLKTCGYVLSDSLVEDVIVMHLLSQGKFEYQTFQDELQKRSL